MSTDKSQILEFQCPKCSKRLKAGANVAGRRVKCPQCGQPVKVPGVAVEEVKPAKTVAVDDWLSLDAPVTLAHVPEKAAPQKPGTRPAPSSSTNAARSVPVNPAPASPAPTNPAKSPTPAATLAQAAKSQPVAASSSNDDDEFKLASDERATAPKPMEAAEQTKRSVFDDDLPDLAELDSAPKPKAAVVDIFQLDGLDDLVPPTPNKGAQRPAKTTPPAPPPQEAADPTFRISCRTCGTPQYVHMDRVGKKTTCSDCHSSFVIPPPPPGWSPYKKKVVIEDDGVDVPLAPAEVMQSRNTLETERVKANEYLAKAQQELEDDEIDSLYQGEFDTAGFFQRTLGFVTDPGAITQVVLFGVVFGGLFGVASFSRQKISQGGFEGGGYLLVFFIVVSLVGILFAMPMLSSGLALLESVANRQRRVNEWPGFNLFENFGEVLAILAALGGSLLPGMLIGGLIGRSGGAEWLTLTGMMGTCFLLFPVLLLSILDNGSIVQPISGSVLVSIGQVPEAWGAYYLKTMLGFGVVMASWYVLLPNGPIAASIAGFLVPCLLFFTCQQMGALADSISEHLSFEFSPAAKEEDKAGEPD